MRKIIFIVVISSFFLGCSSESCKINFEKNSKLYEKALDEILDLDINMTSNEPYYRPVLVFGERNSKIKTNIFAEIESVECHEDGTIIFQAPDCDKESDFRNVVYFLAYTTKGKLHLERKRSLGSLKEVKEGWFLGKHIESLAN